MSKSITDYYFCRSRGSLIQIYRLCQSTSFDWEECKKFQLYYFSMPCTGRSPIRLVHSADKWTLDLTSKKGTEKDCEVFDCVHVRRLVHEVAETPEAEDECPMCLDLLIQEQEERRGLSVKLFGCPGCRKGYHSTCAMRWFIRCAGTGASNRLLCPSCQHDWTLEMRDNPPQVSTKTS